MADISDAPVQQLLEKPNHAVVSTLNEDGTIHSAVAWVSAENGSIAVNSAMGRKWPSNLDRDPRITVTVVDQENPYEYVEIRGRAEARRGDEADKHIDQLAKKYMDADSYPFRQEGEERIKYQVTPERVRHQKQ
jgi:PPOX class probable F420-dependent enzyme